MHGERKGIGRARGAGEDRLQKRPMMGAATLNDADPRTMKLVCHVSRQQDLRVVHASQGVVVTHTLQKKL